MRALKAKITNTGSFSSKFISTKSTHFVLKGMESTHTIQTTHSHSSTLAALPFVRKEDHLKPLNNE